MPLDVLHNFAEVLVPEGQTGQEWVNADGHYFCRCRTLLIQRVKLILYRLIEALAVQPFAIVDLCVIDFDRVWDRNHLPVWNIQWIWFIVIAPVTKITKPKIREQPWSVECLTE